ncbi:MAG: MaoC family dehydratase N-terminal domain-containing protein [Deltaproteobacteria bacterium]|nr:MaoC family dehydratase N-terminal domain-containing protein [Deltaproteobacteria bacterium]
MIEIPIPRLAERAPLVPIDLGRTRFPRYGRTFEELEPGRVFRHPRGLTVTGALIEGFSRAFHEHNALHLNAEHARALGHPSIPAPAQLVFNVVLSLGVQNDSEQAIANLGYYDAAFLRPVYASDTLSSSTKVLERHDRGPDEPGIVTIRTVGTNQRDEVVLVYDRKIMVPHGSPGRSSPKGHAEVPSVGGDRTAIVPSPAAGAPTAGAGVFFEDLRPGDIIVHANGRTITDEHVGWTFRTGNTHPLHFDRVYSSHRTGSMSGEPIVYGGLVFAWLVGLASRDTTESALWEIGFTEGYHTQTARTGDTLSALTRVIGCEPGPEGTGIVSLQLVGVKNVGAAEALERFGADLFVKENDKRKLGKQKLPDKVFEVERRLLVRQRPR